MHNQSRWTKKMNLVNINCALCVARTTFPLDLRFMNLHTKNVFCEYYFQLMYGNELRES